MTAFFLLLDAIWLSLLIPKTYNMHVIVLLVWPVFPFFWCQKHVSGTFLVDWFVIFAHGLALHSYHFVPEGLSWWIVFSLPSQKIPGTWNVLLFAVWGFAMLKLSCEHRSSLREAEFHFISHALFPFIGLISRLRGSVYNIPGFLATQAERQFKMAASFSL